MRGDVPTPTPDLLVRRHCAVSGQVQGVGFRPYVYGLAQALGVTGFAGNDTTGVFVEVQGATTAVTAFAEGLRNCPPPAAVESVRVEELPVRHETEFVIAPSLERGEGAAVVPPDAAPCDDCVRDLFTAGNRRFGYPFVTCARWGPRFTLMREMLFDRPLEGRGSCWAAHVPDVLAEKRPVADRETECGLQLAPDSQHGWAAFGKPHRQRSVPARTPDRVKLAVEDANHGIVAWGDDVAVVEQERLGGRSERVCCFVRGDDGLAAHVRGRHHQRPVGQDEVV